MNDNETINVKELIKYQLGSNSFFTTKDTVTKKQDFEEHPKKCTDFGFKFQ